MKLQCTKKLLDQMKIKAELEVVEDEGFSWHANIVTIDRKKLLVLVHDRTQYRIVFYGMKTKEWKTLDVVIRQGIRTTWRAEGIRSEVIEKYLAEMGDLTFAKTSDRSAVSKLNRAVMDAEWMFDHYWEEDLLQVELSKQVSRSYVKVGKKDYINPAKELPAFLMEFTGERVLEATVATMKIQLDFEELSVWRRVQVPLFLTFAEFHEVIQAVFDWDDSHVHCFYLFGDLARRDKNLQSHLGWHPDGMLATRCLVDHEEALEFEDPYVTQELEHGKRLSDLLTDKMLYVYDMGDDWEHLIEVEAITNTADFPFIRCLAGEGAAPPEDVGGEEGFEEFLAVMADESHEDHAWAKEWSQGRYFPAFDLERIDKKLKRRFQ